MGTINESIMPFKCTFKKLTLLIHIRDDDANDQYDITLPIAPELLYFFFEELFLLEDFIRSYISELREFAHVPTEELFAKDGTLSQESSVTIVMASCS